MIFHKSKDLAVKMKHFEYLSKDVYYFDSACQSLRPQQVIDAQNEYYTEYNACGHRVKYEWGERVDSGIAKTREKLLGLVKKSEREYTVAFTLNTTYGVNVVLHQISGTDFEKIVTSEIEHNSVFLPTMTWAKRNGKERVVLKRMEDGSLDYKVEDLKNSIVILNCVNNIDGRSLKNIKELCKDVHKQNGILLLDASQSFSHNVELLENVDFDALFGSGHKMYGPSIGFVIIKKELVKKLDCFFIGGDTVEDVDLDSYRLVTDENDMYARIQPGLQNYAGIIGLGRAIDWKREFDKDNQKELRLKNYLHQKLQVVPNINILYNQPSSIVSLYSEKIDSHKLAIYLGSKQIMCRSGYHCCHYYLKNLMKYPPLFRVSLGLNNTEEQIDFLTDNLTKILK